MKIAVLAVQGAFIEHEHMLEKLGVDIVELRKKEDLEVMGDIDSATGVGRKYDALVLPGGESTVQGKLLRELDMFDTLKYQLVKGLPVLATCAGMILLAENIANDERTGFQTIPMTVKRNAYGRQLGSFAVEGNLKYVGRYPFRFIRAPYVEQADGAVEVLARVEGKIVAVKYGNQIALAFHPELTEDMSIHKRFLELIENT